MSKNPFWSFFVAGFKGPKYMLQQIERKQKNDQIVHKLNHIKAFVEATSQITRSEVGQQWAADVLRDTKELIRMHSHDN